MKTEVHPPPSPSTGGADNRCLQAAGVQVKLPEEGYWGGSEEEDLAFWITIKIADQVLKAVLDTGATLSILARRLLKQAKIQKSNTLVIRV